MIVDRPSSLDGIPHYRRLPELPVAVGREQLPDLLKTDLFLELCGLSPVTREVAELCPEGITVQPSTDVVRYYSRRKTQFLMISVVANCCVFAEKDSVVTGYPYSLCLLPASKRGELDYCDVELVSQLDLENLPNHELVYINFDPFGGDWELGGPYGLFAANCPIDICYSDSIGFVMGLYFLALGENLEDVLMTGVTDMPEDLWRKYRRFRVKRYFSPFVDLRPRRIWGAESPIELFLLQGLVSRGYSPVPSYLIYEDGSVFPSYYKMFEQTEFVGDSGLLTEADLFFPTTRVAVFCDSTRHHRAKIKRIRDEGITNRLRAVGVTPVRVPGSLIVKDLDRAVDLVLGAIRDT